MERAIRFLKARPDVSEHNKALVMQFLDRLKAEGLSLARQMGYVQRLTAIAVILGKDFDKTNSRTLNRSSEASTRKTGLNGRRTTIVLL